MRQLLGINLQVRCVDGSTHDGIKLFVQDNHRVYVSADGSKLTDVDCIEHCTLVVPPMVLANVLHACKECE
jgi:hypothetical protein